MINHEVPAGTARWSSAVVLTRSVILTGAGVGETRVLNDVDSNGHDFLVRIQPANPQEDPFIAISGFTLDANNEGGCIMVTCTDDTHVSSHFRIHHNQLLNNRDTGSSYMAVRVKGNCFGLIDNNQFINNWEDLKVYGNDENTRDRYPGLANIGTANYLYIEDNTFIRTHSGEFVMSSGEGARWVFRYNRILGNLMLDAHGDTRNVGVVAHESYENVATNQQDPVTGGGFKHDYRGGVALIFNNSMQMGTSGTRGLIQVREEHTDCAEPVNNGYIWNNRNSRDNNLVSIWSEQFDPYGCISEDTDWWDDGAIAPGGEAPSNFWYGPSTARPVTSHDDDCYFETDTRRLHRSIGDNAWVFIYTPFVYPHPLRVSGPLADPPRQCNNGTCEDGETPADCPGDCFCGNGWCDHEEDGTSCAADCQAVASTPTETTDGGAGSSGDGAVCGCRTTTRAVDDFLAMTFFLLLFVAIIPSRHGRTPRGLTAS